MEVLARFEYSDDLLDRNYEEWNDRKQDLFNWFSLLSRCSCCSRLLSVTDFECS